MERSPEQARRLDALGRYFDRFCAESGFPARLAKERRWTPEFARLAIGE